MSSKIAIFDMIYAISYCIFCWCLLIPSLLYYLYQFYLLRRYPVIHKRHYRTVIAINIFKSIWILFRPFWIFAIIEGAVPGDECYSLKHDCSVYLTIVDFFDGVSAHGFAQLLTIRAWFIYFEIKYAHKSAKGQWAQYINPQSAKLSMNSWIFRYRSTLGKEKWVLTRIFMPYYTFSIVFNVLSSIYINPIFDKLLHFPLLIFFIILWCKAPKYYDIFQIRREMVIILRWVALLYIVWILVLYLYSIFNEKQRKILYFITEVIFTVIHWFYALSTTKWVISHSTLNLPQISLCHLIYNHSKTITNLVVYNKAGSNGKKSENDTLYFALSKKETLESFMNHLCNEWSSECLLFIIECYQLKGLMVEDNELLVNKEKTLNNFILPESLPKSVIVYDDSSNIKDKITKLIYKYVTTSSKFEINISYNMRQKIMFKFEDKQQFESMTDLECYQLFDEIMRELLLLLRDSYVRFINDKYYQQT